MVSDGEGFLYPEINDDLCIKCNKCRTYCDFNKHPKDNDKLYEPVVYGFKHKDTTVLSKSTSGGAFTALSDSILDKGGVVFGVVENKDLQIEHTYAVNTVERDMMCGSKYVQSTMGDSYKKVKEYLTTGIPVLFTGTPCQVAGLYAYLEEKEYNNLFTADIICHGVPSPLVFSDYIKYVEKKSHKRISQHLFRGKIDGWGHGECNIFADGSMDNSTRFSQLHRRLFYKNLAERPSCYQCKYTTIKRVSDMTLADFWGVDKEIPELYDKNGVSLLIVNSQKGNTMLDSIKDKGVCVHTSIESALPKQPQLSTPIKKPANREQFWDMYYTKGYYKALKFAFYRPLHEGIVDFLKKIGIFSLLSKALGKE
jgi:coenzyme F420-reducing hydrogenase beta subunit